MRWAARTPCPGLEAERHRWQQAGQQPLRALLDSIDDLAWIKDHECRFLHVNRKFGEVFGVEPASLVGKTDFDLSPPSVAERYQADDRAVMRSRQPSRQEESIARPGGTVGWSETVKVPVLNAAGEVIGTAGVARDVTERVQAQALMAERMDALVKAASAEAPAAAP